MAPSKCTVLLRSTQPQNLVSFEITLGLKSPGLQKTKYKGSQYRYVDVNISFSGGRGTGGTLVKKSEERL